MSADRIAKLVRVLAGAGVIALGAASWAKADNLADETRYPYDPVCSWGRVADGRGMIVRCLTRAEAEQLSRPRPPPSSSAPAAGGAADPTPAPDPAAAEGKLELEFGPLAPDSGRLPVGERKLKQPKDRYLDCVRMHGGLSDKTGEVTLRFLVRERGRAEGVSVTKRRGVSKAAARCLADVVDRRYVGTPDEPLVGANFTLRFSKHAK